MAVNDGGVEDFTFPTAYPMDCQDANGYMGTLEGSAVSSADLAGTLSLPSSGIFSSDQLRGAGRGNGFVQTSSGFTWTRTYGSIAYNVIFFDDNGKCYYNTNTGNNSANGAMVDANRWGLDGVYTYRFELEFLITLVSQNTTVYTQNFTYGVWTTMTAQPKLYSRSSNGTFTFNIKWRNDRSLSELNSNNYTITTL